MFFISKYSSPLGGITLASNGKELTGLWFDGQKYFADNLPNEHEEKDLPIFAETKKWLDIYFSGKAPRLHSARRYGRVFSVSPPRLGNYA